MDFDDIIDWFMGIPDALLDLPSTIGEVFSSIFENITEFSVTGLAFGVFSAVLIFFLSPWLLNPFLEFMSPGSAVITTILSFVATFVACYLIGKRFEDTG